MNHRFITKLKDKCKKTPDLAIVKSGYGKDKHQLAILSHRGKGWQFACGVGNCEIFKSCKCRSGYWSLGLQALSLVSVSLRVLHCYRTVFGLAWQILL